MQASCEREFSALDSSQEVVGLPDDQIDQFGDAQAQ